ncbi:hypothetical protein LTR05_004348 [Lithohypha guttulata]|uniref:Uncharacterized protein n=1 Tax=Lithohypha guttulata TaxID=1690604 RepID=A0AAN7T3A7_9EURO|nr:hypothetical protein LTR05_004348 [Lithohypha guttulata]
MGFLYSQLFVTPKYPTRSFTGETCIVTGSNVGLGKECARHLARLGAAKIILAVRNTSAGEQARQDIVKTTKVDPSVVEVWELDLGDYSSVKAFAKRCESLDRIDAVIENAGIAAIDFKLVEGHESTVTVNVVSTFLLALLLLPKLKEVSRKFNITPRLTIVSSEVHGFSGIAEQIKDADSIFPMIDDPKKSDMSKRYPLSKLLEVLVVREIAPKINSGQVTLNMLNPGLCHSSLTRDVSGFQLLTYTLMKAILARTTEVGSRTLVAAASVGEESHGRYMHDGMVNEGEVSAFAKSDEGRKVGQKVWAELADILEKIEPGVTQNI